MCDKYFRKENANLKVKYEKKSPVLILMELQAWGDCLSKAL